MAAPERVDLEAFSPLVELRLRELRCAQQRDEPALGVRAGERGLLITARRATTPARLPARSIVAAMSRFVTRRLTCACSTASASSRGVSCGAISRSARAGELTGMPRMNRRSLAGTGLSWVRMPRTRTRRPGTVTSSGPAGGPSKTLQRRGGIVCEKRILAAREHGGLRPRKKAGAWRSPEIHASVYPVH